ncbi:MAG: hypothetical protein AB1696_16665 [Planctomycetota bacterium]
MGKRGVIAPLSLAKTLWNLEEARLNGTTKSDPHLKHALSWIARRQGQPGSYGGCLFAPMPMDLAQLLAVPTQDCKLGKAGVMHVLGEEAVRALTLWKHKSGWDRETAIEKVVSRFDHDPQRPRRDPGLCCCATCSAARWRALAAAQPKGWEDILADGLKHLAKNPLTSEGRWKRFPFYYTLLALSEIPLAEVEAERKRLLPAAERVYPKVKGNSQAVRFRKRALEWAVG